MVQLNIFLAILVDGYMCVKQSTVESNLSGLFEDLFDIFFHETQKLINYIWPKYPYLSDEIIISTLSPLVLTTDSKKNLKEVQEHFHSIALTSGMEIHCNDGTVIKRPKLYQLLSKHFPSFLSRDPAANVDSETASLLDPVVRTILSRYGSIHGPQDLKSSRAKLEEDFLKVAALDSMKRIAELQLQQMGYPLRKDENQKINSVTLQVIIEKAKGIPKMDLFRGADVFCAIFLDGSPEIHQTEIRSGLSALDWTWDPVLSSDFKWVIASDSELLNEERKIVVMVYDKDLISGDDLIGCVQVALGELKDGVLDSWRRIIRPPNAPARDFLLLTPPIPELKLKITLGAGNLKGESRLAELSPYGNGDFVYIS